MTKTQPDEPILSADAEPDVWWGERGIDALLWADGPLYQAPTDAEPGSTVLLLAGGAA